MPHNESERLKAVDKFLNLKITRTDELKEIARYAAEICETSSAYISLINSDSQQVLFSVGTEFRALTRDHIFCNFTLLQEDVLVVPDTAVDERFINNPFLRAPASIRFYAGANLKTQEGYHICTLCVIDQVPKTLSSVQQKMLAVLSRQVVHILGF